MATYKRRPKLANIEAATNLQKSLRGRLIVNEDGTAQWTIESSKYEKEDAKTAYDDLLRNMATLIDNSHKGD